jgi:hypothetical protein
MPVEASVIRDVRVHGDTAKRARSDSGDTSDANQLWPSLTTFEKSTPKQATNKMSPAANGTSDIRIANFTI